MGTFSAKSMSSIRKLLYMHRFGDKNNFSLDFQSKKTNNFAKNSIKMQNNNTIFDLMSSSLQTQFQNLIAETLSVCKKIIDSKFISVTS